MPKTVLIVAPRDDPHAQAVASIISSQFDTPVIVWDSARLPSEDHVAYSLDVDGTDLELSVEQERISEHSLRSIWWRRPEIPTIDNTVKDQKVREFCIRECISFLRGSFESVSIPIINQPAAQLVADHKALQLKVAKESGLAIPKTIISNSPEEVLAFRMGCKDEVIYKTLTGAAPRSAETRLLTKDDLKDLNKLRHAPIILQEKIERGNDIRVNIFGRSIFAASCRINDSIGDIDWRLDPSATWHEHALPEEIISGLKRLMRLLNLQYCCVDLMQKPDCSYVFLEVNPAGNFMFVEMDTGQPLTYAMAKLLIAQRDKFNE